MKEEKKELFNSLTHTNILKNKKAITLIALVITIVILIILASVAINMTLGENGIFEKAKKASNDYKQAQAMEELQLAMSQVRLECEANNEDYNALSIDEIFNRLQTVMQKNKWGQITLGGTEGDTFLINYGGYEFDLNKNGKVEKTVKDRPKITNPQVSEPIGEPLTASVTVTVEGQAGKTITKVENEKTGAVLTSNGDGTYTLSGITSNGTYYIKATDSEGVTNTLSVIVDKWPITVTVEAEDDGGTVTVSEDGSGTGSSGQFRFGSKVKLKATAATGKTFAGWCKGDELLSKSNPYEYTVQEEVTITAKFNGALEFPILTPQGFYNVKYLNVTNGSDWYYDLDISVNATDDNAIKKRVFDNDFETSIEVDGGGGNTWFDIDPSCWGKYLYISYSNPYGGYIGCVGYGTSRGIYDIRSDWISGYTSGVVEGYSTIAIPIDENAVFCFLSSGTYSTVWRVHEIWVEDGPFPTT